MSGLRNPAREYRTRAKHCIDIAEDLNGARRLVLLEMAKAWLRLADQAARNEKTEVVYETPDGRSAVQPRPEAN